MRYLVHRGTGTILEVNEDLVIVDIEDSNLDIDEADILELAAKAMPKDKAVILASGECPVRLSDEDIYSELYDYVYNWNDALGSDDDNYLYCLSNPDTWPLIRSAIMNDVSLWNEYSDTWTNAILTVAERHRYRNGVAE
jgi:hypothetical protein